jgi:hypothetical protein
MPGKLAGRVTRAAAGPEPHRRPRAAAPGAPWGAPESHFRATALPGHATAARLCPAVLTRHGAPHGCTSAWLHKQLDPVHIAPTGEPVRKASAAMPPWLRRTNVWRKVTSPARGAKRPRSVKSGNWSGHWLDCTRPRQYEAMGSAGAGVVWPRSHDGASGLLCCPWTR